MFTAFLVGFGCLYQVLTMLPVLTHAVALTALPNPVARVAVAAILGLCGGLLAITLRDAVRRPHRRAGERTGGRAATPRPAPDAQIGGDVRRSAREAIAAVRRHVRADLEHELVVLAQQEPTRVTCHTRAVAIETDATAEAQQPRRRQTPDPRPGRERRAVATPQTPPHRSGQSSRPARGSGQRSRDRSGSARRADRSRSEQRSRACPQTTRHARADRLRAKRARSRHGPPAPGGSAGRPQSGSAAAPRLPPAAR